MLRQSAESGQRLTRGCQWLRCPCFFARHLLLLTPPPPPAEVAYLACMRRRARSQFIQANEQLAMPVLLHLARGCITHSPPGPNIQRRPVPICPNIQTSKGLKLVATQRRFKPHRQATTNKKLAMSPRGHVGSCVNCWRLQFATTNCNWDITNVATRHRPLVLVLPIPSFTPSFCALPQPGCATPR